MILCGCIGRGGEIVPLSAIDRERISLYSNSMADDGLRVLLVASADSKQVSLLFVSIEFAV